MAQAPRRLLEQERADHQRIERRGPEALDRVARRADDRLAAGVERGVDQHRHAGPRLEGLEQVVVERVLRAVDRLDARRAVDVAHGRDAVGLLGPHVVDEQHERRDAGADEPVGRLLLQDDRRDRPEVLAVLDLVEPGLHLGVDRRGEDRARPERPRAELHPALEPADDLVLREELGRLLGDVVQPAIRQLRPAEERLDLARRRSAGPRKAWSIWYGRAAPPRSVASIHSAAPERRAGVAGGGLDPDVARTARGRGAGRSSRSSAPRRRPCRGRRSPEASCSQRASSSTVSSSTTCSEWAMSKCCCSSGRPACRAGPNRSSSRGGSIVYCAVLGPSRTISRNSRRRSAACRTRPAPSPCTRRTSAGSRGSR